MQTMPPTWLNALLARIAQQGSILHDTGGAQAPAASTSTGTGGAMAPSGAAAAGAPANGLAQIGAAPPAVQLALQKLNGVLQAAGQTQADRTPSAAAAAKKFGGQVLGYGKREGVGEFAAVTRGGKLFHVYGNGNVVAVDHGAIADALGVKPKHMGGVEVARSQPGVSVGVGGAQAPDLPPLFKRWGRGSA